MEMKIAGSSMVTMKMKRNTNKLNENNEIIQGIFKMMEKLTERIFQIEMKHKDNYE